jgi:hypothetical protein
MNGFMLEMTWLLDHSGLNAAFASLDPPFHAAVVRGNIDGPSRDAA